MACFLQLLAVTGAVAFGQRAEAIEPARQPNILVLIADDLGWADVGYHGSKIRTPHIDKLAETGVILEQFYVTPMCSSTRASLLSGRYPQRFGCLGATNSRVYPPGTLTLAGALRQRGYDTCITGKWHLGSKAEWGPLQHGFNRSHGALAGGIDQYLHLYKKGPFQRTWHRNDKLTDQEGHATDLFMREAIDFVQAKREGPFYIQVAFTAVHIPIQEPDRWVEPYRNLIDNKSRRHFAACATHMDDAIGQILAALDRTGQRDNTLVIFFSDNGGSGPWRPSGRYPGKDYLPCPVLGDNRPWRGRKGQVYEGGIRVPALVNWPGVLKRGRRDQPLHVADLMPTLCRLAQFKTDQDTSWDGVDMWEVIAGEVETGPVREFYWRTSSQLALRRGDWKIITDLKRKKIELFQMADDPHEKTNLAASMPDRVKDLLGRLEIQRGRDRKQVLPFLPR
ncbi:MAG: sulfatase-like hydrolase/transferase [Phycisphaerae bacterium]|nr:sulfatase-like hydrolase/transferase [Phycisphaerae bacterium]